MTRSRILFLHQVPDLYGSGVVLANILENLDKKKFDVTVVLPSRGPLESILKKNNIQYKIIPFPLIGRAYLAPIDLMHFLFLGFVSFLKIYQMVRKENVDIIYSNTLAVILGGVISLFSGKKHVWHLHEIINHPNIARIVFSRIVYLLSDAVIVNSRATGESWVKSYAPIKKKIKVILNSVDMQRFNPDAGLDERKILGITDKDIIVGVIGRINRFKGHKVLLEAARKILKITPRVFFLIVGDAPPRQERYKEEIVSIIEKEPVLAERIRIFPFVQEIENIYKMCDIVVTPSTESEPFGLVALEAMAMGKPVVASDIGGLKEIILDGITGLLVKPGDPDSLGRGIMELVRNKELRFQMGMKGTERARGKFSNGIFIQQVAEICYFLSKGKTEQ